MIASIDPGLRGCGLAVFIKTELHLACYLPGPSVKGSTVTRAVDMATEVWVALNDLQDDVTDLVLEFPQVYTHGRNDRNDLLGLAAVDGAIAALALSDTAVKTILPHEWKGSVEKLEMVRRIRERLTPEEIAKVALPLTKSLQHNTWDAVGIGLHHLGRLEKRRVIAR